MTPAISFEVYRGTLAAGKLVYTHDEADKCRQRIDRLRAVAEQDPTGWRGDFSLVRLYNGKRQLVRAYRRRPHEVRQMVLRLLETIHADRCEKSPASMPVPAIQRSDDLRPLRYAVGHQRS